MARTRRNRLRIDVDEARLLPHLRKRARVAPPAVDNPAPLALDRLEPDEQPLSFAGVTAGGDWQRLRGLPVVARGVRGVLAGSDPAREALRRLSR